MYDEYAALYRAHTATYGPKTAIFLMVGSFYELYDIQDRTTGLTAFNVKSVTDLLGIQLTVKKDEMKEAFGGPGRLEDRDGLFAGFPDYVLHKHAARLTAAGWTVVVVDQVKDSRTGKVQRREVARILSPSTHVEAMAPQETAYLTTVYLQPARAAGAPPLFGIATLDLTTGTTMTYAGNAMGTADIWTADDLVQQLSIYPPKEVLVYCLGEAVEESSLRRTLSVPSTTLLHVRPVASLGAFAVPQTAAEFLRRSYSLQTMLPPREFLGIRSDAEQTALLFLLQFVEEHFPSALKGFQRNHPWVPEQQLVCGNHALAQLQMDSALSLFQSDCITPMGKRDIRPRILRPLTQTASIEARLQEVQEVMDLAPVARTAMERSLRFMGDLPRLHRRMLLALTTPAEYCALWQTYSAANDLLVANALPTSLRPSAALQTDLAAYRTLFQKHIDGTKALRSVDSEDLSPFHATPYPSIAGLESEIATVLAGFETIRAELCREAALAPEALRLEPREKEPFGLKATAAGMRGLKAATLPAGTTLQGLKSGGWVETPRLATLNAQLLALRSRLATEARRVNLEVCSVLTAAGHALWTPLEEWLSHVDCTQCIAAVSAVKGWSRPSLSVSATASVVLKGVRHPLVEATGTRIAYVQHDVSLGVSSDEKGWLVYGMNASGKSTLMKAVGICVLLAQAGCFVPAQAMTLSPFRAVYTRILNHDNLFAGLSSFAVEMSELRDILRNADAHTLVLGDELCAGTESVSAMSLVSAGIQWLSAQNAKYIFATHLHDLPKLLDTAALGLKVWHLHVEYNPATKKLVYDRTLLPGSGSSLYGLEVARAMDLPFAFLELATANRHRLLGTVSMQEATVTTWSSALRKQACELCGHAIVKDLEVHHIEQRALADRRGILPNGKPMNAAANLVVLCQTCHDAHHAGKVEVAPLVQTSEGSERMSSVSDSNSNSNSKRPAIQSSKWSEEELTIITHALHTYKTASLKAVSYQLKQEGIDISVQGLSAIRKRIG
jgi:DNA mismatch repair protein MutS